MFRWHHVILYLDGTMIDDNPTLVFRVGEYEVVQGLDLCVQVRDIQKTFWAMI